MTVLKSNTLWLWESYLESLASIPSSVKDSLGILFSIIPFANLSVDNMLGVHKVRGQGTPT